MNIGSIGSSSFSFSSRTLSITNGTLSTSTLKKNLKQTSSSASSSSSTGATGVDSRMAGRPDMAPPKELTKDDLGRLKDQIEKSGGQGADKIDDLIKNFNTYDTDGSGEVSMEQFRTYAEQNGITKPTRQKPASSSSSSSSSASEDVSEMTDAELEQAAAQGNADAQEELEKRKAKEKKEEEGDSGSDASTAYRSVNVAA